MSYFFFGIGNENLIPSCGNNCVLYPNPLYRIDSGKLSGQADTWS